MPARTLLPPLAILGLLAGTAYALRSRIAAVVPSRKKAAGDRFKCECGETLRVTGGGRHRIYFQGDEALLESACPSCSRPLPSA